MSMMRSEPHPSSTAENSRFSMMAVTAIHQRLANAVARVGAMVGGWEQVLGKKWSGEGPEETAESKAGRAERERERLGPCV